MKQPPIKTRTIHFIKPIAIPEYVDKLKVTNELKYGQTMVEIAINGKTYRIPYSSILVIVEETT